jgi:hypothetical protein
MNDIPKPNPGHDSHTVRPRWTWAALVLMLVGLVLVAVGVIALAWTWAIIGFVIGAVGAAFALYGGFFYDVQTRASLGAQVRDVVEGNQFQGPDPTDKRSEAEVKRDVHRRWLHDG